VLHPPHADAVAGAGRPSQAQRTAPHRVLAPLTAVLAAAVVAALVVVLRTAGWLSGVAGLVAAVALALAVPTSRLLARRMLLTGAIVVGATPLLWFWDLPVGDLGRVTVVMAAAAGALTAWVLWAGRSGVPSRAGRLVPRLHRVDLLPGAAAVIGMAATLPWLRVRTGQDALSALLSGWDNSAHFDMVAMIRRYGVTTDRLADPSAEHWKFADYPEGFHSFVAAVMETTGSVSVGTPAQELAAFVRAEAWVLVIATTLVTAGVAALPWVRRRPLASLPVVAGIVAVLVLGPGARAVAGGFPNFVLAAALAACIPLLVATMPRVVMPLQLAALGSLLVGVAHSWALLLVVAGPLAVTLLLPLRRGAWRGTRRAWALSVAIVVATAVGGLHAASVIASLDAAQVLVTGGGFALSSPGPTVALCLTAIAVCLLADGRTFGRVGWVGVATALGLAAIAALGAFQLATDGELSYYFWKGLFGLQLVAFVVLGLGVTRALRRRELLPRGPGRLPAAAALLALTVAATQVNGVALSPALTLRPEHTATAGDLLAAATIADADAGAGGRWTYVTSIDSSVHPVMAQQWLLALTGRWTHEANTEAESLTTMGREVDDFVRTATEALLRSPDAHVIVPAAEADAVRAAIAPDLASRVVGLADASS